MPNAHTIVIPFLVACASPAFAQPAPLPPGTVPPPAPPAAAVAPTTNPSTAPATLPSTSPFDAVDPEIRAIGRLNWRTADFDGLGVREKAAALAALNEFLDAAGGKADARAELLVEYLDQRDLGTAYAADAEADDAGPTLSYDDARRIAAAFVRSPEGRERFGDEFTRSPPQDQQRYLELYERTTRRKFDDASEARAEVRLMARFLERRGQLDDFQRWSAAEADRRQREHDAHFAQLAAEQRQADAQRRAAVASAAADRRQQEHELALRRLEYAYQRERYDAERDDRRRYDGYGWYGGGAWSPRVYYYGDAYRANQRLRIVKALAKWHAASRAAGRAPGRPVPRVWGR